MTVPKTTRPFRERFLDGYDRHKLEQEVRKVKPRGFMSSVRKRAAGWGLGAAMALGGIGVPLKVGSMLQHAQPHRGSSTTAEQEAPPTEEEQKAGIAADLQTAHQIASEVTEGVSGAVREVAKTAAEAPKVVAEAPAAVAQAATAVTKGVTEGAREAFFAREIPFGAIIYHEAKKNDLPPELLAAVAHTESQFVPTARSNRGAVGLMQLVPRTGRWLGATNLTNPTENISAGAKYLRYLTDRFGGDHMKAVAAYNAGEGNVRRFGGVPPFRETRNYVAKVRNFQQDLGNQIADLNAP